MMAPTRNPQDIASGARATEPVLPVGRAARWRPLALLAALAFGLFPPPGQTQERSVFVTASFLDARDLPLHDLDPNEIEVSENGQLRKIELLAQNEIPAACALLFDMSLPAGLSEAWYGARGSGISAAAAAREIAFALIDGPLRPNPVMVAGYGRALQVIRDFTEDGFAAKEALGHLPTGRRREESFLYSALFEAVRVISGRREPRRMVVVFLDALDRGTAEKAVNLKSLAAESNVELFVIDVASKSTSPDQGLPSQLKRAVLSDLCSATAGNAYFASDYGDHLEDLERRLQFHFQSLHTLGFESISTGETPGKLLLRCLRPGSTVRSHPVVPLLP